VGKWKGLMDDIHMGVVLFLTTAYLLFIIPALLERAGLPFQEAFTATALAIALPTAIGAFLTKRPFIFGPGVALTAYLAFTVVGQQGVGYDVVLAAVVVEGLILLALSISSLRAIVAEAFPRSLVNGAIAGIGLYLIFLGFQGAGLVEGHSLSVAGKAAISLGVLLLAVLLFLRGVGGSFLWAILVGYGLALLAGFASPPALSFTPPAFPSVRPNFFGVDSFSLLSVVLAILLIDFFDTLGVSTAVLLRMERSLKRVKEVFLADALGTILAGFLSSPSVAAYVESVVAADKPRGPLPAYVAAVLFLLSLFFAPLFSAIPYFVSAPILVVIGTLMFSTIKAVQRKGEELIPMVITTALIPMTGSIALGIMAGLFFYIAVKLLVGKAHEVHPILFLIVALIILDVVNAL